MIDLVKALRNRATWETATGISEPHQHIDWMAADEITRLREENARLRAVIQFILDNQISERRSEHIDCVIIHGEPIRAAAAALKEAGDE